MKKLMIAVAIVCVAAISQAAQISWAVGNLMDDKSVVISTDPTLYLVNAAGDKLSLGGFEYDSGENIVQGVYELVVGTDADGDKYYLMANDGRYVVDATTQEKIAYTLSGFGDDTKSTKVPAFNVEGGMLAGGDVPEPTSGLLLLLGVAGLALRRRRA